MANVSQSTIEMDKGYYLDVYENEIISSFCRNPQQKWIRVTTKAIGTYVVVEEAVAIHNRNG